MKDKSRENSRGRTRRCSLAPPPELHHQC